MPPWIAALPQSTSIGRERGEPRDPWRAETVQSPAAPGEARTKAGDGERTREQHSGGLRIRAAHAIMEVHCGGVV